MEIAANGNHVETIENLGKDDDFIPDKIKIITEWASQQDYLPDTLSERWIRKVLYSCYDEVEATKKTIEAYYKLRVGAPELFCKKDPASQEIQTAFKHAYILEMPGLTAEGYKVIVAGFATSDTSDYDLKTATKLLLMTIDTLIERSEQHWPGIIFVIDCSRNRFAHFYSATPDYVKKCMTYWQDALPGRLKNVVITNLTPSVSMLLNIARKFMSKRLREMVLTYSKGSEEVFKAIPRHFLPIELGGESSIKICEAKEEMRQNIMKCREKFILEDQILDDLISRHNKLQPKQTKMFGWF